MKRIITIISAAVLGISAAAQNVEVQSISAQTILDHAEFGNITINDANLSRNAGIMTINMDLDMSEFNVNTNRAVLLTPYIVKGDEYRDLPSLGFYGRNRYYYYVRNDNRMCEGASETSYKEGEEPEYLPYFVNIPYEDWMKGAELMMERKVYGCCGDVIDTDYCFL